jgi:hypothetical protein
MATYYGPGRYRVRVINQSFVEASTKTLQFSLRFKVLECVEPPNNDLTSYERRAYFSLTTNTVKRVLSDLRGLGCTATTLGELDPDSPRFYDFTGREIELWCAHEPSFDNPKVMRERWGVRGERTLTNKKRLDELDAVLKPKMAKKPNASAIVTLAAMDRDDISSDDDVSF